jgi:hypothetical protein
MEMKNFDIRIRITYPYPQITIPETSTNCGWFLAAGGIYAD